METLIEQFKDAFKQGVLKDNTIEINPDMAAKQCERIAMDVAVKFGAFVNKYCVKDGEKVTFYYKNNPSVTLTIEELYQIALSEGALY